MLSANQIISNFNLLPHPEGGFYSENYRSTGIIPKEALPPTFKGARNYCTAIYFLLEANHFSAFHRIKSDECWHFYAGSTLLIYVLTEEGGLTNIKLGSDIEKGEVFQAVVPANCWFASEPAPDTVFSFVGCTVSPGFDFADFEMAAAKDLLSQWPDHNAMIERLCRL